MAHAHASRSHSGSAPREDPIHQQVYHRPHTSLGATGHWIGTAGILAPLVIGEFVHDSEKRWRYIRIASVATALLSEGLWTSKVHNERKEAREREQACMAML
jgi:hypothetical protein